MLVLVLHQGGLWRVTALVEESLTRHLGVALDESHFSSAGDRVNDGFALRDIGVRVNAALEGVIRSRWYAPRSECAVQVTRVDGLALAGEGRGQSIELTLPRNGIDRVIGVVVDCNVNWPLIAGAAMLLALVFIAIACAVPTPLGPDHRRWINQLLARGCSGDEAFAAVSRFPRGALALTDAQQACFDALVDGGMAPARALESAAHSRVAHLPLDAVPWLLLGLDRLGDMGAAAALATAPDCVEIDLPERTLRIRGLAIRPGLTPLFYYAWYAGRRLQGDGWVVNPPSNRPDVEQGRALAAMMERYDGHARAIGDLERNGLKARTLDQNRSKLKDELAATLGENLAARYLFESRRDPDGVQMSYRLVPRADQLRLSL
jgi:hypothetical protein